MDDIETRFISYSISTNIKCIIISYEAPYSERTTILYDFYAGRDSCHRIRWCTGYGDFLSQ